MNTRAKVSNRLQGQCPGPNLTPLLRQNSGQALVEFTLTFVLLLVVAWIPADFGLAFYTGQLAQLPQLGGWNNGNSTC
jgi:Flp pilus assembly protein TadG